MRSKTTEKIAKAIRDLRIQLMLNQCEFAKQIAVHKSLITLYENGKRLPSYPTMRNMIALATSHNIQLDFQDLHD